MVVLLLLAWLQTTVAPVRGQVIDAATGAPLARVLIVVEDSGASTFTDGNGRFELSVPPGRRTLFVSVIGYALARRVVDVGPDGLEMTVPLSEGTGTHVESIDVQADRFAPAEPAVAAQHALGSAELQNLRGVLADDPMRALQVLPGVVAGDDLRSEFSVRGSPFAQVNMTVEGFATPYILHTVRAIEDYSGSGSVSMINSDVLQDVSLLSGGYPQRFGNRTGAEIDFRLREGSRDRTQARLAVSGTNASAVIEGPLGSSRRGSWLLSARQSYLDLIIKQIQQGIQFGFSDTQLKLAYDVTPAQRLELAVIGGRSRLEERDEGDDVDDMFVARNATSLAIAGWQLTKPRGSVSVRTLGSFNAFSNTNPDEVRIDEGDDSTLATRLDGVLVASSGVYLEGGADGEWTSEYRMRQRSAGGRYRRINDFTGDAWKAGAYGQARVERSRFTLVPGVRVDRWSLTGDTTVSPWVQSQWRLPASLTVRAGTGVYRQFPSFEQVIGALAAPAARPQRAVHMDIGIEQRVNAATRWQVTFYTRDESDFFRRPGADTRLVDDRVVFGSRTARFAQSLDGLARGLEVLVQRKGPGGLSGWVSYSIGRHRYTDTATGETFDSEMDQRHTLNLYAFYRTSDRVSFSAKARLGSNVPAPGYYREADGVVYLSWARNELRLPVYARVDLRANRTFNWSHGRMTLFAEVINVLNRDNVRFNPPGVSAATRQVRNMYETMVPIVPSLGVLFEF